MGRNTVNTKSIIYTMLIRLLVLTGYHELPEMVTLEKTIYGTVYIYLYNFLNKYKFYSKIKVY